MLFRSGRRILEAMIPMLDLAMPYEAPKQVNTIAAAQPMAPKNDWGEGQHYESFWMAGLVGAGPLRLIDATTVCNPTSHPRCGHVSATGRAE